MNKRAVEKDRRARVGRPTKAAKPGTRMSLGLKVTPQIKIRLDNAARESGRTQSQEAELRLERSFERVDLLTDVLTLAYGARAAEPVKAFGQLFQRTVETGPDMHGNRFVFVLDDSDEAVTLPANYGGSEHDPKPSFAPITQSEFHRLARKNYFDIVPVMEIARSAADAISKVIKSSHKEPTRDELAETIGREICSYYAAPKEGKNE